MTVSRQRATPIFGDLSGGSFGVGVSGYNQVSIDYAKGQPSRELGGYQGRRSPRDAFLSRVHTCGRRLLVWLRPTAVATRAAVERDLSDGGSGLRRKVVEIMIAGIVMIVFLIAGLGFFAERETWREAERAHKIKFGRK
jgi:hypothetical protein